MTLEMIRFEHSVFALPFALIGAMLAARSIDWNLPDWLARLLWIVLAMVGARSAAMTFNRLLDADIDAINPRTATRHIPAGLLSRKFAWSFLLAASGVYFVAAAALGPLCLWLAAPALAVLLFYSWTKRFTSLSHLVLGFCLGMAPAAAWIAMTGTLDVRILLLTLAVTCWTAGFDIIYACQDYDFDRTQALHSIPKRLGIAGALMLARVLHILMLVALSALQLSFALPVIGWLAVAMVALLLLWEHRLVRAGDLSRINAAFFTANGWISLLYFALMAIAVRAEWK
jgi:4-hydroxybenzoate polyprenyltransferase